ncbi:MAG TPA: sugar ABC transporter substrate-binding protein, partial [Escherichia coli]|nr:sugar ABC transporter substrate-binding protein [Escherichia coli]
QSGDVNSSKGKEGMESLIKAENNGKKNCRVYARNEEMVMGAIQAIKEAGLKPGKDILTGSIDGVPDIYKAMMDGEANASVELTPNMAGPAFDALEKYKKDGTMPEKLTLTKSTLYLPDTAKEELEKKKNMGY